MEILLIKPSSSPDYDFCALDSFLHGSPALETFTLRVSPLTYQNYCQQKHSYARESGNFAYDLLEVCIY